MATEKQDYSLTSFNNVIIEKDKLLAKLRENRANHNEIYEAAVQGYWIKCAETVEEKKKEFENIKKEQFSLFEEAIKGITTQFENNVAKINAGIENKDKSRIHDRALNFTYSASNNYGHPFAASQSWPLPYPVNHLEDYDRVIQMLEFSVADKVTLTVKDFQSYVRNQWDWRGEFAGVNQVYVNATTGSLYNVICVVSGAAAAATQFSGGATFKFAREGSSYS